MSKFNYFSNKEKKLEKLSPQEREDLIFDLINAFAATINPAESALLLQDLLTENEIVNLAKRLRIAKLLLLGKTHEEVVREMHCSYATITKIGVWLDSFGTGLKQVIMRLPQRKQVYKPKRIPGVGYGLPQIIAYYSTVYAKNKQDARLKSFIDSTRSKSSLDRDLSEEKSLEFRNNKIKRKRFKLYTPT